jgi:hypothetical protein
MITFKTAVDRGRKAVTAQGKANWLLGDIALTVKPEYGDDTVGKLADEIGIPRATLANFRTIAAAYEPDVRETGNSHTVYGIFASQDDRVVLVTGKIWTVREARAEIVTRNGGDLPGDGDMDGDGDGDSGKDEPQDIDSKVARAAAEVMRLEGELQKARAALAKLETERDAARKPARGAKPAAKPAAVKQPLHVVKGIPSHDAGQVRADCPRCRENVARSKAARTAGKPATVKAPGGRRERVAA